MAAKQNLADSPNILDERLCNAITILVKDTELRLGQSSATYTYESHGEEWAVAITRITGKE